MNGLATKEIETTFSNYMTSINSITFISYPHPFCSRLKSLILRFARTLGYSVDSVRKEEVFMQVMNCYDDLISRVCLGYSRSTQDYEDLRQDAYVNIWQSIGKFEGRSHLKTWIYRVVLNTCVSNLRRRRPDFVSSTWIDFERIADGSEEHMRQLAEMYEMIARLPDLDKAIVMMWLDEMSYEEIASVTGLPRNSLATRLRRAKLKLIGNNC